MEQLIRAANFTRYHSRDVDKLSQLPRNCRVRATYHPSNLARREIAAASCAARVPSRTLLFPALFPYIYIQSTLPHHHTRLAKPWQVQRHAECVVHRAWQSFSDRAQPTAQPTSPPAPLLPRLTLTKRRVPSIKSTRERPTPIFVFEELDERKGNCLSKPLAASVQRLRACVTTGWRIRIVSIAIRVMGN